MNMKSKNILRVLTASLIFAAFPAFSVFAAYPTDPTSDTDWPYSSENSVSAIESRFNTARTNENSQLGTSVPMITMPSQAVWDGMDDGEKALWLINRERIDRGVHALEGIETNVTNVAQDYAQYLLDNDAFAHDADGNSPWERLNNNSAINACHDSLNVAENLAALWGGWTLPIERSVYMWMYDDSGSGWGHRHAILWYPYNDNSGPSGTEGFLGIGRATGTHQGYSDSDIIVMNVFDPCSTWTAGEPDPADISTPAPGSALASTSVQFTWNDAEAEKYWLHIGTTSGGNDLYNKGIEGGTSVTVNGLPDTGVTIHVRLWSLINGEWLYDSDCTYTALDRDGLIAAIQSPASGTAFDSTTVTFTWNDSGAEKYWMSIGTSAGDNDLHNKDKGTSTSTVVSGLPDDGSTVYVRLWSKVDGEWLYAEDCVYTAYASATVADIQTPANGSTLDSTSVQFTWNDSGAEKYWLHIGTTTGGSDLHSKGYEGTTSASVNGLPDNGITLHARLWSRINGEWLYNSDFTYTAYNHVSVADIQTPAPGSALASTSVQFTWNDSGAEKYWLHIGTTAGGSELYDKDQGGNTSVTVNGLPDTGVTLHVRLWSRIDGEWLYNTDCEYTAFDSTASVAVIQSPTPGTAFSSTTVTFTWNDTGAEKYWLAIGTAAGGNDIHNKDKGTATSTVVAGLPDNGETLYVRLWSKVAGEWLYDDDCVYTASGP